MKTRKIMVEVSAEAAEVFEGASQEEREQVASAISTWLQRRASNFDNATERLERVMDEIGEKAEANGMTPALLKQILHA